MSRVSPELLAECIADVRAGRRTVDQCVEAHPGEAEELRRLLEIATSLRPSPLVTIDPAFRQRARVALVEAISTQQKSAKKISRWYSWLPILGAQDSSRPALRNVPVPALVLILIVILTTMVSGGATYASQSAIPGDTLYPVKAAVEGIQLRFAAGDEGKAEVNIDCTGRRLDEVQMALDAGRLGSAQAAIAGYSSCVAQAQQYLTEAAASGQDVTGLATKLSDSLATHETTLEGVASRAPEPAKAALDKAVQDTEKGLDTATSLADSGNHEQTVPGGPSTDSHTRVADQDATPTATAGKGSQPQATEPVPGALFGVPTQTTPGGQKTKDDPTAPKNPTPTANPQRDQNPEPQGHPNDDGNGPGISPTATPGRADPRGRPDGDGHLGQPDESKNPVASPTSLPSPTPYASATPVQTPKSSAPGDGSLGRPDGHGDDDPETTPVAAPTQSVPTTVPTQPAAVGSPTQAPPVIIPKPDEDSHSSRDGHPGSDKAQPFPDPTSRAQDPTTSLAPDPTLPPELVPTPLVALVSPVPIQTMLAPPPGPPLSPPTQGDPTLLGPPSPLPVQTVPASSDPVSPPPVQTVLASPAPASPEPAPSVTKPGGPQPDQDSRGSGPDAPQPPKANGSDNNNGNGGGSSDGSTNGSINGNSNGTGTGADNSNSNGSGNGGSIAKGNGNADGTGNPSGKSGKKN